jgi:predicted DNA binding CopG/RHH family protein
MQPNKKAFIPLDEEEKKWMDEVENGNLKSVSNLNIEKSEIIESTKQSFSKGSRVNVRVTDFDLNKLKVKAIEEGMPYQTLIGSILHQYVTGKLIRNQS